MSLYHLLNVPRLRRIALALLAVSATACDRAAIVQPNRAVTATSRTVIPGSALVYVADVEQLYAAVNDAANAGASVVLAPGTYVLTATNGGTARPNAGRLELQPSMSISGVTGDRAAVSIDMSLLPASSFTASVGRTGGIRVGRGTNFVDWLTILGNPNSVAAVETDLADADPTQVNVAHTLAHGSLRGVDVRNTGVAMSGRSIVARIEDNEFFGGYEGIRVLNIAGVIGARIDVTMSGNRLHDNANGCIFESNRASSNLIHVRSSGDRFEHNGIGCLIGGALVAGSGAANSNSTAFEAYGDAFTDNTLAQPAVGGPPVDFGGVLVLGAETPGAPNTASHNAVTVALWGSVVSGNQNVDFLAFGARSVGTPVGVSGVDNHVTIELHGVSKRIDVVTANSLPADPAGTNSVTVIR
jgi:hypothetical protein